jgi:hypothetical protein
MNMDIPQQLAIVLDSASTSITQDGELPATERKAILEAIETLSKAEHSDAGYLRRARLAIICAKEVLTHVPPYAEVLQSAKSMLTHGIAALAGRHDLKILQRENGAFHTKVVDLLPQGEAAFVAAYAGMTVFSAINTVLYDTNFAVIGQDEKSVDPDDWDVGYYGSLAASGSAIWEAKGGSDSRRAYWNWYLGSAIPCAWDVQLPIDIG